MLKEKKSYFIIVRVTKTEKEYLFYQAKKDMKSISRYIRMKLGILKIPTIEEIIDNGNRN